MDAMHMVEDDQLPIGPDKMRKSLTLPKALVARIKQWRFRAQIEPESRAYELLLERALEQAEREQEQDR